MLHSIASFCRYACIGFVMQFFWNHMENNIDESADRPGVLFDTFLTTAVQVADRAMAIRSQKNTARPIMQERSKPLCHR